MSTSKQIPVDRQLEFILGLLNNRRDRYHLWWNALIGLVIAIGAGIGITMVSGEMKPTVLSQAILISLLMGFTPLVGLIFFSLFIELHWIDKIAEFVISQFNSEKSRFYEHWDVPIHGAMKFIKDPLSWAEEPRRIRMILINYIKFEPYFTGGGFIAATTWLLRIFFKSDFADFLFSVDIILRILLMFIAIGGNRFTIYYIKKDIISKAVY